VIADSLQALRRRLVWRIEYGQYFRLVRRVRGAYSRLSLDRLSPACRRQARAAAESLNLYIEGANRWSDCMAAPSCDLAGTMPIVRRIWWEAGR
jgi:hypothetical protein